MHTGQLALLTAFCTQSGAASCNLTELCDTVVKNGADLGVSVDPDVDRLALICEDGKPFGEDIRW